jgi:mRNA-degrading endonuclease toxin of MazEF toxin-antitoxin module
VTVTHKTPLRGEIWFVKLPTDPPGKNLRPVIIVSDDSRNAHPKADTVLVIPISTSIHKNVPLHVYLSAGETGLQEDCVARAEDVTVVRKTSLEEPRAQLRRVTNARICELADKVKLAMGCYVNPGGTP